MDRRGCFDATCPKCKARLSWRGKVTDRPRCWQCGHRPVDEVLKRQGQLVDEMFALLAIHPTAADGPTLRKMRIMAGLGLGQAARRLSIAPSLLNKLEYGQERPAEELAAQMSALYGCGREPAGIS